MSASGAQREPSMEEILASIRRIIEDSESGRKPSDPVGSIENTVIEVDAFRSELRTSSAEAKEGARPAAAEGKPVVISEVPAQPQREARTAPPPSAPDAPPRTGKEALRDPEATKVTGTAHSGAPASQRGSGVDARREPPPGPVAARPPASEKSPPRPAILSEQAERKVAAAFDELSDAFAARNRRTFDELATEMLRPMLQDWLDNNLPGLVERLVREEIERVTRGV